MNRVVILIIQRSLFYKIFPKSHIIDSLTFDCEFGC